MAGLIDVGLIKPELAGAFAAGYRGADVARQQAQQAEQQLARGRQQMELDQMTMDRLKEERAVMLQLQEQLRSQGKDPDLGKIFDAFIASGIPQYVQHGTAGKQKLLEQQQFSRIMGVEAPAAALAPTAPAAAPVNALAPEAAAAPAPVNALMAAAPSAAPAPVTNAMAIAANVEGTRRKINQLIALGTPQALAAAKALETDIAAMQRQHAVAPGGTLVGPQGEVLFKAPEKEPTSTAITEYNFAKTPQGGNFKGSFQDFLLARAIASRPPGPPKEPSKAVEVVDPNDPSKIIIVSAEEAIRRNLTPARAQEGLTVKERQSREAKYPQATSAVKTFETASDNLVNDLQTLINHPGLKSITGIAAGRLPGITEEGREAQALYDKIVARGGFQELQNMRQASPTGGALGNVSNREGDQLKQAFAAIDRTQNADSVKKAARAAIKQIQASKQNVREAYDLTYEYRQGASGAAAPDTGNVAAERAAAKDAISKGAPADAVRRRFKEKTGQEL